MKSNIFYLGWLVFAILLQATLMWLAGDVYITGHESDVLHSLQGAILLLESELPHLDFATPLGVLTFAPIAVLLGLGFGHGAAMAYSGVLLAVVFLPALYWVGVTRLSAPVRLVWSAVIILLFTASVFGSTDTFNSFSMHYNRWSWAIAFILLTAVTFPNLKSDRELLDGPIVGVCLSFLALTKITFFVALAPVVLIALVARSQWRTIGISALVGFVAILVVTIWAGGTSYWFALLDDLNMATSAGFTIRAGGWAQYVSRPDITFALIAMLVGAVLLSRAGETISSVVALALTPAFLFITYYNWGFEPKFLLFLALMMWVSKGNFHTVSIGYSMAMIAFLGPVLVNLAISNLRPVAFQRDNFHSVFQEETNGALLFNRDRSYIRSVTVSEQGKIDVIEFRNSKMVELNDCAIVSGSWGQSEAIMESLTDLDLNDGSQLLVADAFSDYWMFGNYGRLENGAIWQYGGAQGFENAEIVVVPDCAAKTHVRKAILTNLAGAGYGLDLIEKTDVAAIYRIVK